MTVDSREFTFPAGWVCRKYEDDQSFYRNKIEPSFKFDKEPGLKGVDIVAFSPDRQMWLIESKDYRHHQRTKPEDPAREFVLKVRDTLTGLMVAVVDRQDNTLDDIRRCVHAATSIRLAFQFEQPCRHSKLFPRVFDPADVQQQIKTKVRRICPHPLVIDATNQRCVPWKVR